MLPLTAHNIEYMKPYPPGYVTNRISPYIANMPIGQTIRFEPDDYYDIPLLHFYNTLRLALAREHGSENIRTMLQQQQGIVEAVRLR